MRGRLWTKPAALRTLFCLVQWSAMRSDLFCGSVLRAVVLTPVPVSIHPWLHSLRRCKSAPHPPSFIHSFIIHHPSITIHHSFSHHPSIIHTTSTIHSLIDSFIMILSFNIHHPYIVRSSLITHTPFTTHRSPFLHSVIHTFENSAQRRESA